MASDQTVTARHLLRALTRVKRQGRHTSMAELERFEPDLAGYLMEELSLVHQKLFELGAPAARTRWLVRRTEALLLVCAGATRLAHTELWDGVVPAETAINAPGIAGSESPPSAELTTAASQRGNSDGG